MRREQIEHASRLWNTGWSARKISVFLEKTEAQIQNAIDRNRGLFPHKLGRVPPIRRASRNPIRAVKGNHCQWETELGALVTLPMLSILRT